MVKVLMVADSMDTTGGIAAFILNNYQFIDQEKIHIDILVHTQNQPEHVTKYLEEHGSKLYYTSPYNLIKYRKFWKDLLKKHPDYDIIHVHSYDPTLLYFGIAKKYNITTIAHSHTVNIPHFDFVDLVCRFNQFGSRLRADYFLGCSKQAIKDRFGKSIFLSARSRVMPNGIDTEKFKFNAAKREEVRAKLNIENKTALGQVGRFWPQKNQGFTLKVFSEYHKMNPDSVLVFVGGGGKEKDDVEKDSIALGLKESVIFAGAVYSNVEDYLSAFDFFIFPSIYEAFGIALIEAECSGLPCFCSTMVVSESDMNAGLITWLDLNDSPKKWADAIIKREVNTEERGNFSSIVRDRGYDLKESAKTLENYYLSLPLKK